MRKIVGSIIAVCLLQIGFQVCIVVERTNNSFASVSEDVPPSRSQVLIAEVEDELQGSAAVEDRDLLRAAPYHAVARRPRTAPRTLTARTSPKVLFPTVVINIPPQERYEFTAYKAPAPVPAAQPQLPAARPPSTKITEPKKKSILAKVVKKPYDFLKFVASKLN